MSMGVLERLGVEADALAVFLAACDSGRDVRAACIDAGHDGPTSRRLISSLIDTGLVAPAEDEGNGPLVPVRPGKVLARTVSAVQREISDSEALIADLKELQDELQESFDRFEERKASQRLVEVIRGVDAVNERLEALPVRGRHCRSLRPGPPLHDEWAEAGQRQIAAGLLDKAIYDLRWFENETQWDLVKLLHDNGQQVRVSRRPLPVRAVLLDDELAVLPLTSCDNGAAGAILVHSTSIVTALLALFDELWDHSSPFPTDGRNAVPVEKIGAEDVALLDLLFLGLTDLAIANRLGVSSRTVRRRVSEIQKRLGVTTRFQLAARAVQLGWRASDVSKRSEDQAWA